MDDINIKLSVKQFALVKELLQPYLELYQTMNLQFLNQQKQNNEVDKCQIQQNQTK